MARARRSDPMKFGAPRPRRHGRRRTRADSAGRRVTRHAPRRRRSPPEHVRSTAPSSQTPARRRKKFGGPVATAPSICRNQEFSSRAPICVQHLSPRHSLLIRPQGWAANDSPAVVPATATKLRQANQAVADNAEEYLYAHPDATTLATVKPGPRPRGRLRSRDDRRRTQLATHVPRDRA